MSNRKRKTSEELKGDSHSNEVNADYENTPSDDVKKKKMSMVLQRVIDQEIEIRDKEIEKIEEKLNEALRLQHLLRYAVVSSYYGSGSSQGDWPGNLSGKHSLHPAVAGLLRKTRPDKEKSRGSTDDTCIPDPCVQVSEKWKSEDGPPHLTKIPRYIPPVSKKDPKTATSPTRGSHSKIKQRIIVGNVSRWIPIENREDGATHKWMVYVRGPPNVPDLSHLVEKVRFFLHASYRPFDVVEVKTSPFRLSRRGWGEFPIRVQVHFRNSLNKPIDIIHQLKLDRTRSVKDALGSETIVEVWLHNDKDVRQSFISETSANEKNSVSDDENSIENNVEIKQELISESSDEDENNMLCSPEQKIKQEIKTEDCDSHSHEDERISDCEAEVLQELDTIKKEMNCDHQEVVIEDGCFPMEIDDVLDVVGDRGLPVQNVSKIGNHRTEGVASNSILKYPENGIHSVLQSNIKGPRKYFISGIGGPNRTISTAKQGLIKGTSLLIRNSSILPGTSLLLQNAKSSNTVSMLTANKSSPDTKLSLYMLYMSNLSKRLHSDPCSATRHLLNTLPIISPKASDPAYKTVHPYCADSLSTFSSWPLAKQRASEWMRSRIIRKILIDQGFSEAVKNMWTTKDIMQWARIWGYSPLEQRIYTQFNCHQDEEEASTQISYPASTISEKKELYEWLDSFEKVTSKEDSSEEEIDVVGFGSAPKRMTSGSKEIGLGACAAVKRQVIVMGMDPSLGLISRFVDEKSRELGIVVSCLEELNPCVYYPGAQRMLVEALKSFVNYLVRSSLSIACIRTPGSHDTPLTIQVEDVKLALLEREEFDMLTNEGLGTEPEDSSKCGP